VHIASGGLVAGGLGEVGETDDPPVPPLDGAVPPPATLPLLPALPLKVPPEPEQEPLTDGEQVKFAPQSRSALQGSCHR
jgi:hypothetical protein